MAAPTFDLDALRAAKEEREREEGGARPSFTLGGETFTIVPFSLGRLGMDLYYRLEKEVNSAAELAEAAEKLEGTARADKELKAGQHTRRAAGITRDILDLLLGKDQLARYDAIRPQPDFEDELRLLKWAATAFVGGEDGQGNSPSSADSSPSNGEPSSSISSAPTASTSRRRSSEPVPSAPVGSPT